MLLHRDCQGPCHGLAVKEKACLTFRNASFALHKAKFGAMSVFFFIFTLNDELCNIVHLHCYKLNLRTNCAKLLFFWVVELTFGIIFFMKAQILPFPSPRQGREACLPWLISFVTVSISKIIIFLSNEFWSIWIFTMKRKNRYQKDCQLTHLKMKILYGIWWNIPWRVNSVEWSICECARRSWICNPQARGFPKTAPGN